MKIGRLNKKTSFTSFRKKTDGMKTRAYTIDGTDAIVVKTKMDAYWRVYSKNTSLGGSYSSDPQLRTHLASEGYTSCRSIYDDYDYKFIMGKLRNTSKKRAEIDKTIGKVAKNTTLNTTVQRTPEYGVELELETPAYMNSDQRLELEQSSGLIHDVGGDPSVNNGCEIRFNHPTMNGWKLKDVKIIMNTAKKFNATTEGGTAGMHIHISRKDIRDIVEKFKNNLSTMQQILYPINCRKLELATGGRLHYGVEGNIYRDQLSDFGTLEIRAWNATLDPKLFLARIKFCKYFCDWLAKTTEVSLQNFYDSLTDKDKKNYAYMVNHKENPHQWGMPVKAVQALLA